MFGSQTIVDRDHQAAYLATERSAKGSVGVQVTLGQTAMKAHQDGERTRSSRYVQAHRDVS
jgi:hypothetical protein